MGGSGPVCGCCPSASPWFTPGMVGPDAADDRIVELVHEQPYPAASLIYTSDAKLRTRLKALGARVMGSAALLEQIATVTDTMEPTATEHPSSPADATDGNDTRLETYDQMHRQSRETRAIEMNVTRTCRTILDSVCPPSERFDSDTLRRAGIESPVLTVSGRHNPETQVKSVLRQPGD